MSRVPAKYPTAQPRNAALPAYRRYLALISAVEKPSALSVPICVRYSSTIRVMVVTQTSMAIRAKNSGNKSAMPLTIEMSFSKLMRPE